MNATFLRKCLPVNIFKCARIIGVACLPVGRNTNNFIHRGEEEYNECMKSADLGREGEAGAEFYLEKRGYKIVERNWRRQFGELDIVAIAPDKTLVCVEVKTMDYFREGITPENQMTREKMRKFKKAASAYAFSHSKLVYEEKGWRCDCLALVRKGSEFQITHYENI
jgi:putative endonuclease